jgi:protein-serine/threonine kinase
MVELGGASRTTVPSGRAEPRSEPHLEPTPEAATEKLSMTKRLTRMFSTKDAFRSTPETSVNSQPGNLGTSTPQPEPASALKPTPLARKISSMPTRRERTQPSWS